jgi:hypothetical protein
MKKRHFTHHEITCEYCGHHYFIPYERAAHLRRIALAIARCPNCHAPRDKEYYEQLKAQGVRLCKKCGLPNWPNTKTSGTHSADYCNRCYIREYRAIAVTKRP